MLRSHLVFFMYGLCFEPKWGYDYLLLDGLKSGSWKKRRDETKLLWFVAAAGCQEEE